VLANINGDTITEADLEFLAEIDPRIKGQIANPSTRERVLAELVNQSLLYQEAVKKGMNRDPKVKRTLDFYRRNIISSAYLIGEIENAAKKHYEEHQDEFTHLELAHIMISFEDTTKDKKAAAGKAEENALNKIKAIKARLEKGEDFATLAKELSDDNISKSRGGQLGQASKNDQRLAARGFDPLVEKAFEMKVGEVSGPIKTAKGYHLITVTKAAELAQFEEVKDRIAYQIGANIKLAEIDNLKKQASVVYPQDEKRKAAAEKAAEAKDKSENKAASISPADIQKSIKLKQNPDQSKSAESK